MPSTIATLLLLITFICCAHSSQALAPSGKNGHFQLSQSKLSKNRSVLLIGSTTAKAASLVDVNRKRHMVLTAVATIKTVSVGDLVAKTLGYVMGAGAFSVYLPILLSLFRQQSADGFSSATWIFNVLGLSLSCLYPFKKGFPLSTYVELVAVTLQSIGILGLISHYQGKVKEYIVGLSAFLAAAVYVITSTIPQRNLAVIQVIASLVCNYANIPQIILTFQTKKASWSMITSSMRFVKTDDSYFTCYC
jgi:uncharacterized protein with PQ loop repeat